MSIASAFVRPLIAAVLCVLAPIAIISQTPSTDVEIAAVGDILLDRSILRSIDKFGTGYPFELTAEILSEADIAFGNLENPLTGACKEIKKKYVFRAEPAYAGILSRAGLDILSLANNHSADCGQIGLDGTFDALAEQKLRYVGAGKPGGSGTTAVFEVRGLKIGFAAFTAISPTSPGDSLTGVSNADPTNVLRAIADLRERADVIVVSYHWGGEYELEPNREQIDLALLAVEAGAQIVLGHHPHVLQGIQIVDRGNDRAKAIIAYSLGNFVFDSPVRLNRLVGESMILRLRVNALGLAGAEIVPVSIQSYRPLIATGSIKDKIQKRMARLSDKLGTQIIEGRVVTDASTPANRTR